MSKTLFEKRKPLGRPSIKPQGSKMRVEMEYNNNY
jgi:hypothetical protein